MGEDKKIARRAMRRFRFQLFEGTSFLGPPEEEEDWRRVCVGGGNTR